MTIGLAVALACGPGSADVVVETSTSTLEAPDLTGSWTATGPNCSEGAFDGTLLISGAADALTFSFPTVSVPGAVDATFTWSFEGPVSDDDAVADGLAHVSSDVWTLDGDLVWGDCNGAFSALRDPS